MKREYYLFGLTTGFLFALVVSGWWLFSEGIGVSGGKYEWPFMLFETNLAVTGDIFLTLTAAIAGTGVYLALRGESDE